MIKLFQNLRSNSFAGGIVLPEQHHVLRVPRIDSLAVGRVLRIPIRQHATETAEVVVRVGQEIEPLELLAETSATGVRTHSPVSGRVTALGQAHTTLGRQSAVVEIAAGKDEGSVRAAWGTDTKLSNEPDEWARRCNEFGIINVVDGRLLSAALLHALRQPIDHLVVRAMGAEPWETAAPAVLLEQGTQLARSAALLGAALRVGQTWIAVTKRFHQGRRLLRRIARGLPVTPVVLPDRYPQAHPHLLARAICGRTIKADESLLDRGILVTDSCTLEAFSDMAYYEIPRTHTVITVMGDAVSMPGDYRVPLGTPVSELLESVSVIKPLSLVVANGFLTGRALQNPETVIEDGTTSLVVLSAESLDRREARTCVRCGWCAEDCPVGLNPAALMNLAERFDVHGAQRLHPEACIDCAVCTYVCPAHLELARGVKSLRQLPVQKEAVR